MPVSRPQPDDERSRLAGTERVVRSGVLMGLAASLIFHAMLLVVAALWIYSRGGSPEGQFDGRGVELAVMDDVQLQALLAPSEQADQPQVPDLAQEPSTLAELSIDIDAELSGPSADLEALTAALGGGDIAQDAMGGAGGEGSASFFGLEARGNRFAYIADVSGSMSVSGKIDQLQTELIESIQGLIENARFAVCLYADGAQPLTGQTEWIDASKSGVESARRRILRITAGGGTAPLPAFEQIFKLRPKPDAIFFMTDGEFEELVALEIARLNRSTEIPIHCITFGSERASALMQKIARDSGGSYRHVKGPGE